jgi:hypothetical protein
VQLQQVQRVFVQGPEPERRVPLRDELHLRSVQLRSHLRLREHREEVTN